MKSILLGDHLNGYQIQFNPVEVGDHAIDIKIGGNSIPGCPFLVKVYDAKKVKVTDIKNGTINVPIYFTSNIFHPQGELALLITVIFAVDASNAGAGNLEIIVSSNGRNVPNYVQSEGNAKFRVNFKPTDTNIHVRTRIVELDCPFNDSSQP